MFLSHDSRTRTMFLLVVALAAFGAAGDDRFQLKVGKDLAYRSGPVSIDHSFGSLDVRTHNGSTVQLRATIRSSDAAIGRQIQIATTEGTGGVSIRTIVPEVQNYRGRLSYSIDMTIGLPANAPLLAKNRFGNTDVRGLQASGRIESKHGSVTLRQARGAQNITNAFGSIKAVDTRGDLVVVNSNGSISVRSVDGQLNATNRFGSITVEEVRKGAVLTGSHGGIEAMDITGPLKATNRFGHIKASMISGPVEVSTAHASVHLNDIAGAATVRSDHGSLFLERIGGSVNAVTSHGSISLAGVRADDCHPVSLRTSFGSIRIALPASAGYNVNARTSFGRINSDLPIAANAVRGEAIRGTIGRGGCPLELTNQNGNITIERE